MLGFIIGAASGTAQFWVLLKFTRAITGGTFNSKSVLLGVFQFFIPLAVLLGCAFFLYDELLWAGVGMASTLLVLAFVTYFRNTKK